MISATYKLLIDTVHSKVCVHASSDCVFICGTHKTWSGPLNTPYGGWFLGKATHCPSGPSMLSVLKILQYPFHVPPSPTRKRRLYWFYFTSTEIPYRNKILSFTLSLVLSSNDKQLKICNNTNVLQRRWYICSSISKEREIILHTSSTRSKLSQRY